MPLFREPFCKDIGSINMAANIKHRRDDTWKLNVASHLPGWAALFHCSIN